MIIGISTTVGITGLLLASANRKVKLNRALAEALVSVPEIGASLEGTLIDWSGEGKLMSFTTKEFIVCEVSGLSTRLDLSRDAAVKKKACAAILNVLTEFIVEHQSDIAVAECNVHFAKSIDWDNDGAASFSLLEGHDPDR